MAGFIKTIIDGILEGLDQMAQDPQGPPQRRRVPQDVGPVAARVGRLVGLCRAQELAAIGTKMQFVVEAGSMHGGSAIRMAMELDKHNLKNVPAAGVGEGREHVVAYSFLL